MHPTIHDQIRNAYLVRAFCLSDLPYEALSTTIWVNNKKRTIDTGTSVTQGNPVTQFNSGGRDLRWVKFLDGSRITLLALIICGAIGSIVIGNAALSRAERAYQIAARV